MKKTLGCVRKADRDFRLIEAGDRRLDARVASAPIGARIHRDERIEQVEIVLVHILRGKRQGGILATDSLDMASISVRILAPVVVTPEADSK